MRSVVTLDNDSALEICRREVLDRASGLWEADPGSLVFVDISENVVYSYANEGRKAVLRLTHRGGRTPDQLEAELEWIGYLRANGAGVPAPVPSSRGNLVETLDTSSVPFHATSLSWLEGREVGDEDVSDALVEEWGRMTGMLHALTKDYVPRGTRRFHWHEDDDVINRRQYVPADQVKVHERFDLLLRELESLPSDRDSYGLVHSDAHYGNFFLDGNGRIQLFDFDDCHYNWFMMDLATVWYWALHLPQGDDDRKRYIGHFRDVFMKGYQRHNSLEESWFSRLPLFLKYQEMLLYVYLNRIYDQENLTRRQKEVMDSYRKRIENDIQWFGKMDS
jgi:Ser/Thr protein kinase RdoA (MazF antagonist)